MRVSLLWSSPLAPAWSVDTARSFFSFASSISLHTRSSFSVAVFPANAYMAVEHEKFAKQVPGGRAALLARLPVQLLFIAWARAAGR